MLEKRTNTKMRVDVSASSRIFLQYTSSIYFVKYAFKSSNVFFTPST